MPYYQGFKRRKESRSIIGIIKKVLLSVGRIFLFIINFLAISFRGLALLSFSWLRRGARRLARELKRIDWPGIYLSFRRLMRHWRFSAGPFFKDVFNISVKAFRPVAWLLFWIYYFLKSIKLKKKKPPVFTKRRLVIKPLEKGKEFVMPLYFGWELVIKKADNFSSRLAGPFKKQWQYMTALVFVAAVVSLGIFFRYSLMVGAATHNWAQNSWSGGASALSANHYDDKTGWDKYGSKDANISAGANLSVAVSNNSVIDTADTDFASGTPSAAQIVGTGESASLELIQAKNYTDWSQETIGSVATTKAYEVYTVGSYAYVADDSGGLRVVDVSNYASPVVVGTYDSPGYGRGVHVSGTYAYLADGSGGLRVVNIANPAAPSSTGVLATSYAYDVYVVGSYAYVADYSAGLKIIDISNPASPSLTGSLDTDGNAYKVYVSGNYAYIGDGATGLKIIDISNPAAPSLVGTLDTDGQVWGIYVSGGYAYVADYSAGLKIADISNPAAPSLVGSLAISGSSYNVYMSGGYVYIANNGEGLVIADVSNPASPRVVAKPLATDSSYGVYVSGNYVYLANYLRGINVIDISNIIPFSQPASLNMSMARDVYVSGDYAYVANSTVGLDVINISDPAAPSLAGNLDTSGQAYGVYMVGNYAYVADNLSGLKIINVSDPAAPSLTGSLDTDGTAYAVYVVGNYAYVGDYDRGLKIMNISNPAAPSLTGSLDTDGMVMDLFVLGNYAYLADRTTGLKIVDISNPAAPSLVGSLDTDGQVWGVYVAGNYAYLGDDISGLKVVDVSNPAAPSLVASLDTSSYARSAYLVDNYIYLANSIGGLVIIDVTNPLSPEFVASPNTGGNNQSTFVVGNYAYVADQATFKTLLLESYSSPGSFVSQVFNTANKEYDAFSWQATVPGGTSVVLKARTAASVDMSGASDWGLCNPLTSGQDISANNCVSDAAPYIQYRVELTSSDPGATPSLGELTIGYSAYQNGSLISSKYDTGSDLNILAGFLWDEDVSLPSGTGVSIYLRSAGSEVDLEAAVWREIASSTDSYLTDGCLKDGATITCDDSVIPSVLKDLSNDRWLQYKTTLVTTLTAAPTLDNIQVVYVVNAPPEVENVTATQGTDGLVNISYEARDEDSTSGTNTRGYITPSFEYWNGSSWVPCATLSSGATENQAVEEIDYTTYSLTWNAPADFSGQYMNGTAKIRVTVNDNEAANNIATAVSPLFTLDTEDPVVTAFTLDARSDALSTLTITASDDTGAGLQMKLSNNSNLSVDAANPDSGQWLAYAGTKSWVLNGEPSVVYYQIKDAFGNISSAGAISSVTAPTKPQNIVFQDISNADTAEWREFVAWGVVPEPLPGFKQYNIYRSTDGVNFSPLDPNLSREVNYVIDDGLNSDRTYYYKVTAQDDNDNISSYSTVVSDSPDGQGGSDLASPNISNVEASAITTQSATITWDTDEPSDSSVDYISVSGGDFTEAPGSSVATMADTSSGLGRHQVVLNGLEPNTTYYFQVKSADPDGNPAVNKQGENGYSFVTLSGPVISAVSTSNIQNRQATITWTTDEAADSYIFYSINTDLSSSTQLGVAEGVTSHAVSLSNLAPGTTYYYYVKSGVAEDKNVVNGQINYYSFTTTLDNTAPLITFNAGSDITSVTDTSARITWVSNEQATSTLEYGLTELYGETLSNDNYNSNHIYDLSGLTAGATYYLRLKNTDINGYTGTASGFSFTTTDSTDVTSPVLSDVSIGPIYDTVAIVNWTTDEAADSRINYGTTSGSYTASSTSNALNIAHSLALSGLAPDTTYYLSLVSADASHNSTTSLEYQLTTRETLSEESAVLAREVAARAASGGGGGVLLVDNSDKIAPLLQDIVVSDIGADSATVVWTTDEEADGFVEYGATNRYGQVAGQRARLSEHQVVLKDLLPSTIYYYQISSADASGNVALSEGLSFATVSIEEELMNTENQATEEEKQTESDAEAAAEGEENLFTIAAQAAQKAMSLIKDNASKVSLSSLESALMLQNNSIEELSYLLPRPVMSGVPDIDVSDKTATISWRTDKKASSLVALTAADQYNGRSDAYLQVVGNPEAKTLEHKVVIYDLEPNTTYHYQLRNKGVLGSEARSDDFTFQTTREVLGIAGYSVQNTSANSATFKWTTNSPTDSSVKYTPYQDGRLLSDQAMTEYDKAVTTVHEVSVEDFEPGVVYEVELISRGAGNETVHHSLGAFSTADDDLPPIINQIQNVSAISPGKEAKIQTIISWNTNELSTGRVYYQKGVIKTENRLAIMTPLDENYTKRHLAVITKFEPGTVYSFQTESTDSGGNVSLSKTYTILTPREEESVFQVIVKNMEGVFGWIKKMQ